MLALRWPPRHKRNRHGLRSQHMALAIGCLSRLACTPMHETRQGRALIVDARRTWYNTQSSSLSTDNVLAPSSIPPSSLSFIHGYLFSTTETRPWSSSIHLSYHLGTHNTGTLAHVTSPGTLSWHISQYVWGKACWGHRWRGPSHTSDFSSIQVFNLQTWPLEVCVDSLHITLTRLIQGF